MRPVQGITVHHPNLSPWQVADLHGPRQVPRKGARDGGLDANEEVCVCCIVGLGGYEERVVELQHVLPQLPRPLSPPCEFGVVATETVRSSEKSVKGRERGNTGST